MSRFFNGHLSVFLSGTGFRPVSGTRTGLKPVPQLNDNRNTGLGTAIVGPAGPAGSRPANGSAGKARVIIRSRKSRLEPNRSKSGAACASVGSGRGEHIGREDGPPELLL